mgnify:CR=1 FL=1
MQKPEIWADQKKASELGSQIRDIKDNLEFLEKWQGVIDDTETALEIADEELINEVAVQLNAMEKALEKFEVKQMLSGEYDEADAILTINAGAGGTDAQDWASLMLRMYIRWAESHEWKVELLDKLDGDEADQPQDARQRLGPCHGTKNSRTARRRCHCGQPPRQRQLLYSSFAVNIV